MRPRRAARPPVAPAGSARGTIGAVSHRGEDPPHDGGIAAGSVQRVVIIWPPASRSRFGGLAFDDPDDVEGSHVRHDPPSPRPAQGRQPPPPPRHLGPHVAPGACYRRWHREDLPPYWCRAGNVHPDTDRGLALSGTAGVPHPPDLPPVQHQTLVLCGDDDLLAAHVNHRVLAVGVAAHGSRWGILFCAAARMRSGRSSRRSCAARLSRWRCKWA